MKSTLIATTSVGRLPLDELSSWRGRMTKLFSCAKWYGDPDRSVSSVRTHLSRAFSRASRFGIANKNYAAATVCPDRKPFASLSRRGDD